MRVRGGAFTSLTATHPDRVNFSFNLATMAATPLVRRLAVPVAGGVVYAARATLATAAVPPRGFRAAGVVAGIKKRQVGPQTWARL